MQTDINDIIVQPPENLTSFRARFGPAFINGTHVFFYKKSSGRPSYHGVALVEGRNQLYRRVTDDPYSEITNFTEQFGQPDSVHVFTSLEAAHVQFPEFYL